MRSRLASTARIRAVIGSASTVVFVGTLAASHAAALHESGISVSNVSVGINGQYQVGRWTALEADVESPTWPVQLTVVVSDPDGNLTYQPSAEVPQPDGNVARIRTLFKSGRLADNDDSEKGEGFDGSIQIQISNPKQTAIFRLQSDAATRRDQIQVPSLTNPWTLRTQFWGTLGDSSGFVQTAQRLNERDAGPRWPLHVIELSSAAELPIQESTLESLSVLTIVGRHDVSSETNAAIRRWVADGGHLIVSVATRDDYASMPLSDWIPIRVIGQSPLRDLSPLTTRIPGSAPLRVGVVDALQFEFDHGETIAATLDGPLWARVPFEFGWITILGVDLSQRPMVNWESLPVLCERLTEYRQSSGESRQRSTTAQLSQTGVSDLQTQLAVGLDQFPGREKPTNWLAMGLILLYLLVIGPLDYLIVHKLLKRPHWTWVTFPLMVLLTAGGAAAMAKQRHPHSILANQIDLVDLDAATAEARLRSWTSFTIPESARCRLRAELALTLTDFGTANDFVSRLSWTGIPEAGFRGMYRGSGLDQWKAPYRFTPGRDTIVDLPVALWSSASTTSEWSGGSLDVARIVSADLSSDGGQLSGTLTNQTRLPLSDWFLAHEGRVYLPQTRTAGAAALRINPGEVLNLDDRRRVVPRVLQSSLTGVRRVMVSRREQTGEDVVATRDTYDSLDRDGYDTLRMVSFYAAGTGKEFTSLTNDSLRRLDLSSLLALDRAVLFCRIDAPAVNVTLDGVPLDPTEHETVLRIVLPVQTPH